MMRITKPKRITIYQVIPLVIFLLVWEISGRASSEFVFFFGLPSRILSYLITKTLDFSLPIDFAVTFTETFLGFIIGSMLGTLIGLSLWYSRMAFIIAQPYIIALGSAPIFALAPLLIIWFGTGMFSKV